jgi:hypothetical protein
VARGERVSPLGANLLYTCDHIIFVFEEELELSKFLRACKCLM